MGTKQLTATVSRDHHTAIMELIDLDPFSEAAAVLRAKIARLEESYPTLIVQRCRLMAEHSRPIGGTVPAQWEGIIMR